MTDKHEEDVETILREFLRKKSAGFSGDLIIHFNEGSPQQIEKREFLKFKDVRKTHEAGR